MSEQARILSPRERAAQAKANRTPEEQRIADKRNAEARERAEESYARALAQHEAKSRESADSTSDLVG